MIIYKKRNQWINKEIKKRENYIFNRMLQLQSTCYTHQHKHKAQIIKTTFISNSIANNCNLSITIVLRITLQLI